jgi:hypothetical protein
VKGEGGSADLAERLHRAAATASRCAREERERAAALKAQIEGTLVALAPELPRDIHDLAGLDALRQCLS